MKKILFLSFAFFGMLFLTSCSQDDVKGADSVTKIHTDEAYSQTLEDIKLYNSNLLKSVSTTRSIHGNDKLTQADIMGAVYGFGLGDSFGGIGRFFGVWGWAGYGACVFAGTVAGAVTFSWKQYQIQSGCAITGFMTESMYASIDDYCCTKTKIENGVFSVIETSDSILNRLNIPSGFNDIEKVGIAHNKLLGSHIINLTDLQGLPTRGGNLSGNDLEELLPLNPCAEALFDDSEFANAYDDLLDVVDIYNDTNNTFDYSAFLNDNPLSTTTATNILRQFMTAFQIASFSTASVINLVNDYINIIESNNELTTIERQQLYICFIVATYSYDHWYGSHTFPIFIL